MAAPAPAISWEQAEREAVLYAAQWGYIFDNHEEISGPTAREEWRRLAASVGKPDRRYAQLGAFKTFMTLVYPQFDQMTDEFRWSESLASVRTDARLHGKTHNIIGRLARLLVTPAMFSYLAPQRMTPSELNESAAFLLAYGRNAEERAAVPRIQAMIRERRHGRTAMALSRVGDYLGAQGGTHVARHLASFVHSSFGPTLPQRPLVVRTHLGEVQRLRAELAAGIGMSPEQLLARVRTVKRGLDEVIASAEQQQNKKHQPE